ncbi:AraC-binding-like domain-containing protein [Streptomyces indicus]|uniref:AraC-binding-like domain-containing protein n=1 Tax=Streptomyces indicus TaxID=417292 RepID=A0A1G9CJ47_9ACTN|nr:AraC-binding-like domain-containing protein [Streptomyces indicus]
MPGEPGGDTAPRVIMRTRQVDEARGTIADAYYTNSIELLEKPTEFDAGLDIAQLGQVTSGLLHFGTDVRMSFGELGAYHVDLPLSGHLDWTQEACGEGSADAAEAVVFDPVGDVTLDRLSGDCRVLAVKFDQEALQQHLEKLLGRTVPRPLRLGGPLDVSSGVGRDWARLARWLQTGAHDGSGLFRHPLMARQIEELLFTGLLLAADHPYREETARARRAVAAQGPEARHRGGPGAPRASVHRHRAGTDRPAQPAPAAGDLPRAPRPFTDGVRTAGPPGARPSRAAAGRARRGRRR